MPLPLPSKAPVPKLFDLTGKVVLITGGARGIGRSVAEGFAEAGASVAITFTSSSSAPQIATEIAETTKQRVAAYKADVRDRTSIQDAMMQVRKDFGRLDVVVANAGIAQHQGALETSPEDWSEMMRVNLDGAFWTAQAAGKVFKEQGYGNLIFTASVSATLVNLPQQQAAYNASKAAVVHLAKCLAVEWADFARVNCVSPGFIATDMINDLPEEWQRKWHEMIPGVRFCEPWELKGAYVFLGSNASSYTTGANIICDGGYTLP